MGVLRAGAVQIVEPGLVLSLLELGRWGRDRHLARQRMEPFYPSFGMMRSHTCDLDLKASAPCELCSGELERPGSALCRHDAINRAHR